MIVNNTKNRDRDAYTFANINLLGKCNVNCYFCLGKDIEELLSKHNQQSEHFSKWRNFISFLRICKANNIHKLYITGQNTDSLLYKYLDELIDYLHAEQFGVGLRTNGYLALKKMTSINKCDLNVGYSIHTLNPITSQMILCNGNIPDWEAIISQTDHCRASIVLNRCNQHEFFDLLRYLSKFDNIKYIQVRRVSTDTRLEHLTPDIVAYEQTYSKVREIFPIIRTFFADAEIFEIYGKEVVFWRTIKTSANSFNYFTDGTISEEYFIIEGYLKNQVDKT